jgi:hypothetical protein
MADKLFKLDKLAQCAQILDELATSGLGRQRAMRPVVGCLPGLNQSMIHIDSI